MSSVDINDEGFLAADITKWITKHRSENKELFDVVDNLGRIGIRVLWGATPRQGNNQQLLVALLYGRVLSLFQAVTILTERGVVPAARAVVRVMCEPTYSICACVKDANFVNDLIKDDRYREADLIRSLLGLEREHVPLPDEEIERLEDRLKQLQSDARTENPKRLGPYVIAERAGLLDHYRLIYSPFSNTVHAAIRDLDSHVKVGSDGEIAALTWGPDSLGIETTLSASVDTFFAAVDQVLQLFPQPELTGQIHDLWQKRKLLLDKPRAS